MSLPPYDTPANRRELVTAIVAATDWPHDHVADTASQAHYADLLTWAWRVGALPPDNRQNRSK